MAESVGAYDAKTHLPRLLDQVAKGESFVITRHGTPVARLVPAVPVPGQATAAIAALREARRGVRRGRLSVRRMIEEGRR